jgi:hypothetical protein
VFVIADGSERAEIQDGPEAATQVGHEAATKVGTRTQHSNGNKPEDDNWIEVQSNIHRRGQRQPLILIAKGTCIMRGHPTGGSPPTGNFPIVNNARFYNSEVNSIQCNYRNNQIDTKIDATEKSVRFAPSKSGANQNKKTNCAHKRTRLSLVPKGNHRSVL